MIELFPCHLGRTLNVPMLDPFNSAYRSRIEAVAELIRPVVENWESFRDMVAHAPENMRGEVAEMLLEPELDRPQHVAYMVRRLAEMLSCEEIEALGSQPFICEAINLSRSAFCGPSGSGFEKWSQAEQAMKVIYDGFSVIQGRLDLGLEPFTGDGIVRVEKEETFAGTALTVFSEDSLVCC
jgi:hypothetical protein